MHWVGYAILGLFSLLLVLVAFSDVVRLAYLIAHTAINSRAISFSVLGAAVALSLVGLFQARCPRIKNVSIAIDNLPA